MPRIVLPALPEAQRPTTAVLNKSDLKDDKVYSACVVAHGGTGSASLFTIPKGQTTPLLRSSSLTTAVQSHQATYTDLTTNLSKAGEFGSGLGDVSCRAIAITLEPAAPGATTLLSDRAFGATVWELTDVQAKMFFELKIGQKRATMGPIFSYGTDWGTVGDISTSTTANNATSRLYAVRNGNGPNRFKVPIQIARNDTVEGLLSVAGSTGLEFSTTTGAGQPALMWTSLFSIIRGDVR